MERHNSYLENRGLLHKLGALVSSEVGDVMNEVVADAEAGSSIATVQVTDGATAHHVAETLRGYDAHDIVYYRPHTLGAL